MTLNFLPNINKFIQIFDLLINFQNKWLKLMWDKYMANKEQGKFF